jgi:excinuclease UvrABC nuclease subunit
MGLDDFGAPSTDVQEHVAAFKSRPTEPHVRSAVYGICDSRLGECLYIGEAKWLVSRLNDHYNTRTRARSRRSSRVTSRSTSTRATSGGELR